MDLRVEPVSPVIGAEVSGIDLSSTLDDAIRKSIEHALSEHLLLFFRDQNLTFEQHKAFGRRFGDLHLHPAAPKDSEYPEILVVHGDDKISTPIKKVMIGLPNPAATTVA